MKHVPVTELDNENTSKKFDDGVISESCDIIVFFPIYGQFGAIREPDSRRIICKFYVFLNSNLLSHKNRKQN